MFRRLNLCKMVNSKNTRSETKTLKRHLIKISNNDVNTHCPQRGRVSTLTFEFVEFVERVPIVLLIYQLVIKFSSDLGSSTKIATGQR